MIVVETAYIGLWLYTSFYVMEDALKYVSELPDRRKIHVVTGIYW